MATMQSPPTCSWFRPCAHSIIQSMFSSHATTYSTQIRQDEAFCPWSLSQIVMIGNNIMTEASMVLVQSQSATLSFESTRLFVGRHCRVYRESRPFWCTSNPSLIFLSDVCTESYSVPSLLATWSSWFVYP